MKKIITAKYLILLTILTILFACNTDKSSFQLADSSQWKAPSLSTPASEEENVFLESNKDNDFKTLEWEKAVLAPGVLPNYTIQISTENTFPDMKTFELTTTDTNSAKISIGAMNEKLIGLLTKIDSNYQYSAVSTTVYLRVIANIKAQAKVQRQYGAVNSAEISFKIVPYRQLPPAENKCTTAPLVDDKSYVGLIGDAVNGWGDTDDHKMGLLSDAEKCKFITKVTLKPGGFKIRANGKWDVPGNWGDIPFPAGGTANDDGGSGNSTVTEENKGTYTVTFDLVTLAVTFEKEGDTIDTTISEPSAWIMPTFSSSTATTAVFTADNLNMTPTPNYETFTWTAVNSGSTTTEAKYTLQIGDMMNFGNGSKSKFFGEPQSELTKAINKKEINAIILDDLGGTSGTAITVYIRLRIQVGPKTGYNIAIERTITPIALCPTNITSVGIIGTGSTSANGWTADVNLTQDSSNTNIYRITTQLQAGEFKLRANDGWDINWNITKLTNPPTGFTGTDNIEVAATAAGNYDIVLDVCADTFTVTKKTSN